MRFTLVSILIAVCLYGAGYYPSVTYDPYGGPFGMALGLGLAFFLIVPNFFVTQRALSKSHKAFLITFGAGFLIRLVLLVTLIILYAKYVREKDFSFTLAFGAGYLSLSLAEILSFKSVIIKDKSSDPSS
ncbi:MAG: hypothetical protein ABIK28_08465 [Planctomycetota bacterium]